MIQFEARRSGWHSLFKEQRVLVPYLPRPNIRCDDPVHERLCPRIVNHERPMVDAVRVLKYFQFKKEMALPYD